MASYNASNPKTLAIHIDYADITVMEFTPPSSAPKYTTCNVELNLATCMTVTPRKRPPRHITKNNLKI